MRAGVNSLAGIGLMSSRPRAESTSTVLESIESLRFEATTFASMVEIWKEGADESPGSLEVDSPDCESEASSFVAVVDAFSLPPSSVELSALDSDSESELVSAADSEFDPVALVLSPSDSEEEEEEDEDPYTDDGWDEEDVSEEEVSGPREPESCVEPPSEISTKPLSLSFVDAMIKSLALSTTRPSLSDMVVESISASLPTSITTSSLPLTEDSDIATSKSATKASS